MLSTCCAAATVTDADLALGCLNADFFLGGAMAIDAEAAATALGRLAGALGVAVSVVLTGPPFFAERVSPAAGTAARSESFVGNGVTRLEDWAAAWQVFERWPVTGAGFDGFRAATEAVGVGDRAGRTAYVHNGFLQGLTDGGLLLGLPLLVVTLVLAVAVCRGLPSVVRRGATRTAS